jgi:hypothetical protein
MGTREPSMASSEDFLKILLIYRSFRAIAGAVRIGLSRDRPSQL